MEIVEGGEVSISIITPVLNCSELIPVYQKSTAGAEVVIVDNASTNPHAENWRAFAKGAGRYLHPQQREPALRPGQQPGFEDGDR